MRTIKFRAWNKTQKIMKEVLELEWVWDEGEENRTKLDIITSNGRIGDKLILMQFTGLHDKSGKEIYEGDIVQVGYTYVGDYRYEDFIGNVIFEDGCYFVICKYDEKLGCELDSATIKNQEIEVIGNIYENSELL